MLRTFLAFTIMSAALIGVTLPADGAVNAVHAGPTPSGGINNGSPEAIVISYPDGSSRSIRRSGRGGSHAWECIYYAAIGVESLPVADVAAGAIRPSDGQLVVLRCWDSSGSVVYVKVFVYDSAHPFAGLDTPDRAAAQARKLLSIANPTIALSPPTTVSQLVGVSTWLWLADPWQPLHASATLDGVTSTVTASPTTVVWNLGDGTTLECYGPGTAYDLRLPPSGQHSECTHVYQAKSQPTISATVSYVTSWTASTGAGGSLQPITRSSSVVINVQEAQALID